MTMPKWHETMRPILEALAKSDGCLTGFDLRRSRGDHIRHDGRRACRAPQERAAEVLQPRVLGNHRPGEGQTPRIREKKGTYRITGAGRLYLADFPGPITAKALYDRCSAFRAWKDGYRAASKAKASAETPVTPAEEDQESPQEIMESAYGEIRSALADDLISAIMLRTRTS